MTHVSNSFRTSNSTTAITSNVLSERMKLSSSTSKFISSQLNSKVKTLQLEKPWLSNHLNISNVSRVKPNISIYNTSTITNDISAHQTSTKYTTITIINCLSSSYIIFINSLFFILTNPVISFTISLTVKDSLILEASISTLFTVFSENSGKYKFPDLKRHADYQNTELIAGIHRKERSSFREVLKRSQFM